MHDLDKLIADWRRLMRPRFDDAMLDEMEDHLREKVRALCATGVELDAAWKKAVGEFGAESEIAREYDKVKPGVWLPIKIAIGFLAVAAMIAAAFVFSRLRDKDHALVLGSHVFTITMGYLTVFAMGAVGGCFVLRRCVGEMPVLQSAQVVEHMRGLCLAAVVLTGLGLLLASVWSKLAWQRSWTGDPKEIGGQCVFWWLLLVLVLTEPSRRVSARTLMMLTIFGNIIVSFAWLGAHLWSAHSYNPFLKAQLLALICVHAILLAIGFAPTGWLRWNKARA